MDCPWILTCVPRHQIGHVITWLQSVYPKHKIKANYESNKFVPILNTVQLALFVEENLTYDSDSVYKMLSCRGYTHLLFNTSSHENLQKSTIRTTTPEIRHQRRNSRKSLKLMRCCQIMIKETNMISSATPTSLMVRRILTLRSMEAFHRQEDLRADFPTSLMHSSELVEHLRKDLAPSNRRSKAETCGLKWN